MPWYGENEMTCKKQTVVFLIFNIENKIVSIGTNYCKNPQLVCPREIMNCKTGEGYELCKNICNQEYHAEIDSINNLNNIDIPSFGLLIGHTYCCDNCLQKLNIVGITNIIIIKELVIQ